MSENEDIFSARRALVFDLVNNLLRNHPPLKMEVKTLLSTIHEDFPELNALKNSMKNLPPKISITQFEWLPIFDLLSTIEKEIVKKPYNTKRGKIVFSNLLWLIYLLYFKDYNFEIKRSEKEAQTISYEKSTYEKSKYEINAERIILNIQLINQIVRELSNQVDAQFFREDIPLFYSKLSNKCIDYNDFVVRIQSLASIFETSPEPMKKILPQESGKRLKSFSLIENWLSYKGIKDYSYTNTWRKITQIRNNPPTHSTMDKKTMSLLHFFNVSLPIDYVKFWDIIVDYLIKSIEECLISLKPIT